jgi:D-sedoheptulose 7-phosphate isomerase
MSSNIIQKQLEEAQAVLSQFLGDRKQLQAIEKAGALLVKTFKNGRKAISCGNGGSMCDAMHFAEELTGRFRNHRKSFPAIAISDPSHLSCVGNDYGYEKTFSRFIEGIGARGDVLLAISSSGNSQNILNAIKSAQKKGMSVIGLTGKNGGEMARLCDIEIRAPFSTYADRAQEIHIKVIHSLILYVEQKMKA